MPRGEVYESPSIQRVTPEMLDYWEARSQEAAHPVLRARYADLVWDLSRRIRGTSASVDCPRTVIDATTQIGAGGFCEHDMRAVEMLERAVSLALSINDRGRLGQLVGAITRFEQDHAETSKPGTWGYAYDLLVENRNVHLNGHEEDTIIGGLEDQLAAAVEVPEGHEFPVDHFAAQAAAERLARYHRRAERPADVTRVLRAYSGAVVVASRQTTAMVACAWLQTAHEILVRFGCTSDADRLAVVIQDRGRSIPDEMTSVSVPVKPPSQDEIDEFLAQLLADNEDESVLHIVVNFLPDPEHAERQVKKAAEVAVLSALFSHTIVDEDGRDVARIGSVADDMEGRVVQEISRNMSFGVPFLNTALQAWVKRYGITPEKLTDRLMGAPVFDARRTALFVRGLRAYLEGDHDVTVHLLVPQVEAAIRNLFALSGHSVRHRQANTHGGRDVLALGVLLRHELIPKVFGERGAMYLQVLLTDRRGWNLRNNICHGLCSPSGDDPAFSDRLVHVLLMLSLLHAGND